MLSASTVAEVFERLVSPPFSDESSGRILKSIQESAVIETGHNTADLDGRLTALDPKIV